MKCRDLTAEQMVAVECPTCGAGFGEPCELNSGSPRFEPHHNRKLAAADAMEAKLTRAELATELRELRDQQLQSFSAATFAGWTPELKTAHQKRSDRIAEIQRELRIVDTGAPAAQFPNSSSDGNQQQQTRSIDQPQRARYTSLDIPD
jgi:hypothetical protein